MVGGFGIGPVLKGPVVAAGVVEAHAHALVLDGAGQLADDIAGGVLASAGCVGFGVVLRP